LKFFWRALEFFLFLQEGHFGGLYSACINTKHNKVRITQSQWTSRKHAYWRSLQATGKWKWGRQMARPWKPPPDARFL